MKQNVLIISLILLTFFVISFLTNMIGPLVPDIIDSFDLSLTLVALLPFAFFIAYGLMSIPSGMLIERFGEKKVILAAFGCAFTGAFLFASGPSYGMYIVSLFFIGAGMAMLQVAINPLLRVAGGESNFAFNSVIGQLFFGLASFLSPLMYTYLVLNIGKDVEGKNAIVAVVRFPKVEKKEGDKTGAIALHLELLKNPTVIKYFLAIFAYVGTEQGIANWISKFLETYHGVDPQTTGASTISWYWGLMTAGALFGLALLKILDSRKVLILFTGAAMVCLAISLFGPTHVILTTFPLIGFFASVMWSVIISLGLNSLESHHGSVSGILVTGIAGGAIVPLIVGSLGDAFGLRMGMLFLFVTMGYIFSVGFWARPLVTNKTIKWGIDNWR